MNKLLMMLATSRKSTTVKRAKVRSEMRGRLERKRRRRSSSNGNRRGEGGGGRRGRKRSEGEGG